MGGSLVVVGRRMGEMLRVGLKELEDGEEDAIAAAGEGEAAGEDLE